MRGGFWACPSVHWADLLDRSLRHQRANTDWWTLTFITYCTKNPISDKFRIISSKSNALFNAKRQWNNALKKTATLKHALFEGIFVHMNVNLLSISSQLKTTLLHPWVYRQFALSAGELECWKLWKQHANVRLLTIHRWNCDLWIKQCLHRLKEPTCDSTHFWTLCGWVAFWKSHAPMMNL